MRRLFALLVLLSLAPFSRGQAVDTAAQIVDRYLEMLGNDRWPADSLLVMETVITSPGSADTFMMKRWFLPPQMMRVEVWLNDTLQTGLCSNGSDRYRKYVPSLGRWEDVASIHFYARLMGYDFRGPLYGWRTQGAVLTYKGPATVLGREGLQAVKVEVPERFARYYFFEPSGLMAMVVETEELDDLHRDIDRTHIDWKFVHEYQQVGRSMLPKQESFLRDGKLTVLETTAHFKPRNTLIFNQD